MLLTRRAFGQWAAAAVPLATRLTAQPHSVFGGVEIGAISYSFRDMPDGNNAQALLRHMVELGLSGMELMSGPAEEWAGAPAGKAATPAALKAWRLSVPIDRFRTLRQLYNNAGVRIYAFKLELEMAMPDAEFDYAFHVAQALGATHLTMELPTNGALSRRAGEFAARHKLFVGYHAHEQATPNLWDEALKQSPYNAINLDLGHYTEGTNSSPLPFLKQHHERIVSVHLKDRKYHIHGGAIVPWGQGDTPLQEALQVMRAEKYRFPASIEMEYPIPPGSTIMAEMARCVRYCKDALA